MNRQNIIDTLKNHEQDIRKRGVIALSIFGSVARDDNHENSDIDVLVEFPHPPTFDQYMELKFFLEDLLESPIDLVTPNALKKRLRATIIEEAIRVA